MHYFYFNKVYFFFKNLYYNYKFWKLIELFILLSYKNKIEVYFYNKKIRLVLPDIVLEIPMLIMVITMIEMMIIIMSFEIIYSIT